jgi:hypothetical protein
MNILDAIHGRQLFGPLFKDVKTWRAWEVYLRGLFGLGLERRTRASGKDLVKHKPGGYDIHMLDARKRSGYKGT